MRDDNMIWIFMIMKYYLRFALALGVEDQPRKRIPDHPAS